MSKTKKKIGLLGGIGPEATGNFYLTLISKFQEKCLIESNKDFPQIIINSIPAPELIYQNISKKELESYIKGLKELEGFDVDFIVMVCNTVYLFYERLQKEIKIPIINLRKEIKNSLSNRDVKLITVLGTPAVIKEGLYEFRGIESLNLSDEEIGVLSKAIFNFNKGFNKEKQVETVKKIARKYLNRGSEIIVLGCTELALMLKGENIPKIETMDVLAEKTIEYFLK